MSGKRITNPQYLKMREQRAAGWSYEEIAGYHDIAPSTARERTLDVLLPDGTRHLKCGAKRKVDYAKARRLKDQGLSYAAIARRFGVSDMAIHRALKNPDASLGGKRETASGSSGAGSYGFAPGNALSL